MTLFCLDPGAIRALQRDGLGWGHDLDCGCHRATPARPGLLRRAIALVLGRAR